MLRIVNITANHLLSSGPVFWAFDLPLGWEVLDMTKAYILALK